jgi:hypothetical protein
LSKGKHSRRQDKTCGKISQSINKPMGTQILKVSYTDLKINVHSLFRKITDKTEDLGRDLKTKKQRNRIVSHTCEEQSRFLVSMPLGLCLSSSTWAALTTFIH